MTYHRWPDREQCLLAARIRNNQRAEAEGRMVTCRTCQRRYPYHKEGGAWCSATCRELGVKQ